MKKSWLKSFPSTAFAGSISPMTYRLADYVQVRKESWGLLFYHQPRHKILFVKSGDWLYPEHFDGAWTFEKLLEDIGRRTGKSIENISSSLTKLTQRLTANGMLLDVGCGISNK